MLVIIFIEFFSGVQTRKSLREAPKIATRYSIQQFIIAGLSFFVPLISLLLQSNEFDLNYETIGLSTLLIFLVYDFIHKSFEPKSYKN